MCNKNQGLKHRLMCFELYSTFGLSFGKGSLGPPYSTVLSTVLFLRLRMRGCHAGRDNISSAGKQRL